MKGDFRLIATSSAQETTANIDNDTNATNAVDRLGNNSFIMVKEW
jgi:hypothetical protein